MDAHRIKIEIGSHKLDAETSSKEEMDERIAVFKELVLATGGKAPPPSLRVIPEHAPKDEETAETRASLDHPHAQLFKIEGKTVSLITPPRGQGREGDAFLLVLWGQKLLRGCDWVLVGHVKAGLTDSGFRVDLVDNITRTVSSEFFQKKGERRGKQFRLLNPGLRKAQELAEEIVTSIS